MHREREEFIRLGISEGLWERAGYDEGSLPKLWVTQKFLWLDEKTQNNLLNPVYFYFADSDGTFGLNAGSLWADPLVLKIDNGTPLGKRIGTYTPLRGWKP
jgi:hypothetical protein